MLNRGSSATSTDSRMSNRARSRSRVGVGERVAPAHAIRLAREAMPEVGRTRSALKRHNGAFEGADRVWPVPAHSGGLAVATDSPRQRTAIIPRRGRAPGAWRSFASCARSRAGWRAPTPSGGRRTGSPSGCAGSAGGSRSSRPTSTRSTALVHAAHCLLGVRRQPGRDRDPGARLRRSCCSRRPRCTSTSTRRFYLLRRLFFRRASQNVVSPRRAARRRRRGCCSCAHLDAARTGRASTRRSAPRRFAAARRSAPASARPLPDPLLVARGPASRCSARGWRASTPSSISRAPAPPHPRPADRRLRPRRHRALRRRPRRQRQRLRGRDRDLARRASSRPSRRRTSTSGSCSTGAEECLQEGMRAFVRAAPQDARAAEHLRRRPRLGRPRRRALRDRRRAGSSAYEHGPPPDRALRGDRDRRRRGRRAASAPPRCASGFGGDALPARLAGCAATAITCLDADGYVPPTATCPPTCPRRSTPRRSSAPTTSRSS